MTPAEQPNASATGRHPKHAAVAVPQGIVQTLSQRELEGVLARDRAHAQPRHPHRQHRRDRRRVISAIANWLPVLDVLRWRGYNDSPLGFDQMLATIILAPIAAMIVQMTLSRGSAIPGDATGAKDLGDGSGLADALRRSSAGAQAIPLQVDRRRRRCYIVNPLAAFGSAGWRTCSRPPPPRTRPPPPVIQRTAHDRAERVGSRRMSDEVAKLHRRRVDRAKRLPSSTPFGG